MKFSFEKNPKWLGVPYSRPDDGVSHAFIDLKLEPGRLDELPEPRRVPELHELLAFLSQPESPFLSLGCEQTYNDAQESIGDGRFISYVGIAILGWPFGDERAAESIGMAFYEFLKARAYPDTLGIIVEQRPCVLRHRGVQGWSVDFWLCGFGASEAEARVHWKAGMTLLREFLEEDARRWNELLAVHPTRESFDAARTEANANALVGA